RAPGHKQAPRRSLSMTGTSVCPAGRAPGQRSCAMFSAGSPSTARSCAEPNSPRRGAENTIGDGARSRHGTDPRIADMYAYLAAKAVASCRAEPGDLHAAAHGMALGFAEMSALTAIRLLPYDLRHGQPLDLRFRGIDHRGSAGARSVPDLCVAAAGGSGLLHPGGGPVVCHPLRRRGV